MKSPLLLKDTKRALIYQYGTDGQITVSKRLSVGDELDYVELLESGDIQIKNCSKCKSTIDLCGNIVDPEALAALDSILG